MSKDFDNNKANTGDHTPHPLSKTQPISKSRLQPKLPMILQAKLSGKLTKETNTDTSNTQLPEEVQAKMENSFGQDFSNVNIHPNSGQAENIGAKAYAQGKDIHFAPGEYNPNTKSGQELLGHELTHVVQQGQGKVGPGEIHGSGLEINKDATLEKEADDAGKKAALGEIIDVQYSSSLPGSNGDNPIQRFEAPGHEAAERTAMTEGNKFSNDEASMIYYGNWMRDMNQALVPALADSLTPDIVFVIINFLGYQKFGRYMNAEEFGYYIPAEHIDNPAGQVPDVDYYKNPPAVNPKMQNDQDRFNTASWANRPDAYVTPQANNDPITGTVSPELKANLFSVDQSGVMAYIRRTNLHVEDRLQYAAEKKRTPEGMMHFGAALHAVEDLFAHSNYVEIALDKLLKSDSSLLPDLEPENRFVRKMTSNVDNQLPGQSGTMPVLTTGTFTGADTLQSVGAEGIKMLRGGLGDVKTEVEKAAQSELMDKIIFSVDKNPVLKKKIVDAVFVPLVPEYMRSAIVPRLYNAPLYDAYSILQLIPKIVLPVNLDDLKNMIRHFINNNVMKPAAEEIEARLLVSKVQDTPLYRGEAENNKLIQSGGKTATADISSAVTKKKPDYAATLAEANKRKQLFDKTPEKIMAGPSHSQLAKDHSDSIFFGIAFKLAVEADKILRDEMLNYWTLNQFEDPDSKILTHDPKTLKTDAEKNKHAFVEQRTKKQNASQAYGRGVYANGHQNGQSYNLQAIRNEAADDILLVAKTLTDIQSAGTSSVKFLEEAKKMVGKTNALNTETKNLINKGINTTEKGANKVVAENNKLELDKVAREFTGTAEMVRSARTLEEREDAYQRLLYARGAYVEWVIKVVQTKDPKYSAYGMPFYMTFATVIDKELAAVAPGYTKEQINLLSSPSDPLQRSQIKLPSVTGTKYESLIMASRKIIDHPYASNWWEPHVKSFIKNNPDQLKEEIRARNLGYVHF